MNSQHKLDPLLRYLLAGTCIVIITVGLKMAADVVNIVCLSILLALAVLPLPSWMIRKGMSRGLAVALTLLVVVVGGILVLGMLAVSVNGLIEKLPEYKGGLATLQQGITDLLVRLHFDVNALVPSAASDPQKIIEIGVALAQQLLGVLTYSLLMIFIAVFVLVEIAGAELSRKGGGEEKQGWLRTGFLEQMQDVRKYISITGWIGLVTAGINLILLVIVGVDFPLTWAFLSFLFNYIPNVGFILSVLPPAILALLESGWTSALIVVGGFLIVNTLVESALKPRLMSKGLDVSVLVLVLGLVYWSWVLGVAGAILAVPLTLVVKNLVHLQKRGNSADGEYA